MTIIHVSRLQQKYLLQDIRTNYALDSKWLCFALQTSKNECILLFIVLIIIIDILIIYYKYIFLFVEIIIINVYTSRVKSSISESCVWQSRTGSSSTSNTSQGHGDSQGCPCLQPVRQCYIHDRTVQLKGYANMTDYRIIICV